jgi:hypothetical protein
VRRKEHPGVFVGSVRGLLATMDAQDADQMEKGSRLIFDISSST